MTNPSDLPKSVVDDIATVLGLAALTDDRTRAEQAALGRLAERVDKQRNRQSSAWMPPSHQPKLLCTYPVPDFAPWPQPGMAGMVAFLQSVMQLVTPHPKTCPCRGTNWAWEPSCGWSRVREEIAS